MEHCTRYHFQCTHPYHSTVLCTSILHYLQIQQFLQHWLQDCIAQTLYDNIARFYKLLSIKQAASTYLQLKHFFRAISGPSFYISEVGTLLNPSPLNAIVLSLPKYGILPAAAIASMNSIAGFLMISITPWLQLSFDATMRSLQETEKKSIFLLPAIPLSA